MMAEVEKKQGTELDVQLVDSEINSLLVKRDHALELAFNYDMKIEQLKVHRNILWDSRLGVNTCGRTVVRTSGEIIETYLSRVSPHVRRKLKDKGYWLSKNKLGTAGKKRGEYSEVAQHRWAIIYCVFILTGWVSSMVYKKVMNFFEVPKVAGSEAHMVFIAMKAYKEGRISEDIMDHIKYIKDNYFYEKKRYAEEARESQRDQD